MEQMYDGACLMELRIQMNYTYNVWFAYIKRIIGVDSYCGPIGIKTIPRWLIYAISSHNL